VDADPFDELSLRGDGVGDEIVAASIRARAPREIMYVEVGHRGGDRRSLPIEHRMMNENDGDLHVWPSVRLRS
jgi:hypothetical protein